MRRVLALVFALAAPAGAAERFPASLVPLLLRQSVCSNSPLTACSGGGAGAVTAGGNNTFTGTNIFQDQAKFQIQNQADATKVFETNLSGITTGNTVVAFVGGTAAAPTWGVPANPWSLFELAIDGGTTPSLQWYSAGALQGGLSFTGSPTFNVFLSANGKFALGVNTMAVSSTQSMCWSSATSTAVAGCDTSVLRDHAGALRYTTTAAVPTATSCGTGSPTVAGNDRVGIITTGTTPGTTCTLTFTGTWGAAPVCHAQDYSTQVTFIGVPGTASWVLTSSASMGTGDKIGYLCERAQ